MTKHSQIIADIRTIHGNSLRKIRKQGILPANLFSKDIESVSLQFNYLQFLKVFKEVGKSHVVDVTVGKTTYPCIVHGLDIHPVTGKLRHVDLLLVNLKRNVTASVPLQFVGESPAVKEFGAVLMTPLQEIEIEALPDNLPDHIEIDLSSLVSLDDAIRIIDLPVSTSYKIITDSDTVLATMVNNSDSEESNEETTGTNTESTTTTVNN